MGIYLSAGMRPMLLTVHIKKPWPDIVVAKLDVKFVKSLIHN